MLESQGVAFLEQRIVRTRSLQLSYLRIVGNGLRELTGIEIAVAYTVQRIGIRRLSCQGGIDIDGERLTCLVVFVLREMGITLQIPRNAVVVRALGIRTTEETGQILLASLVVTQTVVGLCAYVVRFSRVGIRLVLMRDHFCHPIYRLLHLALQEVIGA